MENLSVELEELNDQLLIKLQGQLTLMDALELKKTLPQKAFKYSRVTIDLHKIDAIDLTGFNAILMTKKYLKDKPLEIKAKKDHTFFELAHLTKFTNQFVFAS